MSTREESATWVRIERTADDLADAARRIRVAASLRSWTQLSTGAQFATNSAIEVTRLLGRIDELREQDATRSERDSAGSPAREGGE